MDGKAARDEVKTAVEESARFRNLDFPRWRWGRLPKNVAMICLGMEPLETLLAEDGIADIMINGLKSFMSNAKGKIQKTDITHFPW